MENISKHMEENEDALRKETHMDFTGKLYDISQPVYHNCPQWPDYEPVQVDHKYTIALNGFNAERVSLTTHSGTHIDAPYHFVEGRATIGQVPIETYAGPVVFLDLRGRDAGSVIGKSDIEPHADRIAEGDIVVLTTGWGDKRAMTKEFLLEWPYLDGSGAQWLVDHGVRGVGIDALSMGGYGSPEKGQPCHKVLLGANKFIIEELHVPDELLDGKKRFLTAFPILLENCGGGWTRAVVWDVA
jgi:kynurenine formamidase